jgi:hypothetical protein
MRNPNILVFFFLLLSLVGRTASAQNLDIDLLRKINLERNTALDPTFKFVINSVAPIGLGAPLLVTSIGFIQHDKSLKNKGYYIGATLLTSAVLTTTLKSTIDRDRPFVTYPDIQQLIGSGSAWLCHELNKRYFK